MHETKKIVRIVRKDIPGDETIENALRNIKGIGFAMAKAIRIRSGLPKNTKFGDLSESQISMLSSIIEQPHKFNFPYWILNRRKDIETGFSTHLIESELTLSQRNDIERMKLLKSYKGIRHMYGLPVRGQRTRSSGRKGRTVGVIRKSTLAPGQIAHGKTEKPAASKKQGKE